jgi:hypothetical protein
MVQELVRVEVMRLGAKPNICIVGASKSVVAAYVSGSFEAIAIKIERTKESSLQPRD